MGSKPQSELHSIVTCSVCLEYFQDPRNLDCGHILCSDCVVNLVSRQNTILCPECRSLTRLGIRNVLTLPKCFIVSQMVEAVKQREKEEKRKHFCEQHQKELEYWCQRCCVLVCVSCAIIGGHKLHEMTSIREQADTARKMATGFVATTKQKLNTYADRHRSISEQLTVLDLNQKNVELEIRSAVENAITALQQRRTYLINEVRSAYRDSRQQLERKGEAITTAMEELSSVIVDAESTLQSGTDIEIIKTKDALTSYLAKIHDNNELGSATTATASSSSSDVLTNYEPVLLAKVQFGNGFRESVSTFGTIHNQPCSINSDDTVGLTSAQTITNAVGKPATRTDNSDPNIENRNDFLIVNTTRDVIDFDYHSLLYSSTDDDAAIQEYLQQHSMESNSVDEFEDIDDIELYGHPENPPRLPLPAEHPARLQGPINAIPQDREHIDTTALRVEDTDGADDELSEADDNTQPVVDVWLSTRDPTNNETQSTRVVESSIASETRAVSQANDQSAESTDNENSQTLGDAQQDVALTMRSASQALAERNRGSNFSRKRTRVWQ